MSIQNFMQRFILSMNVILKTIRVIMKLILVIISNIKRIISSSCGNLTLYNKILDNFGPVGTRTCSICRKKFTNMLTG